MDRGMDMKYLSQFGIILIISLIGEVLHAFLPLPVPASVYGLLLMLLALMTGIIKLHQVEKAADLMIELMPLFFVPPGVSLITSWADISGLIVPFVITVLLSTVAVMVVTGRVTQAVMRKGKERE